MKKFLLFALVPLLSIACSSKPEEQPTETPNAGGAYYTYYVQKYIDVTDIVHVINNNDGIILSATGIEHVGSEFNKMFNDISFNRTMSDFITSSILNHFVQINLVSSNDFDEMHKAGSSLNDIAYFVGGSALPFINGKYDDALRFNWNQSSPEAHKNIGGVGLWYHPGYSPIYIKLQDITDKSLILASDHFGISFATKPTVNTKHNFTLSIIDCNGKELNAVFDWEYK